MNARITVVCLAVCGPGCGAWGQNALDRPLDRNTQRGSGGLNPARPNFAEEVRFRNAIVTGNAPGGVSFRGDVGYRAPGEFLGALPSNQNFTFRRDSFYSGLGGLGIRGTDALQYQFAMTTGNNPPPALSGFLGIYERSGAGAVAGQVRAGDATTGTLAPGAPRVVRDDAGLRERAAELYSMRSPSSFVANRSLQPTSLGMVRGEGGQAISVNASMLRGLSYDQAPLPGPEGQPAGTGRVAPGSENTAARPRDIERPASPTSLNEPLPGSGLTNANPVKPPDNQLDPAREPARSPYEDLIERLKTAAGAEGATGADQGGPDWQQRLDEMRQSLSDRQGAMAAGAARTKPARGAPGATGVAGATGATGLTGPTGVVPPGRERDDRQDRKDKEDRKERRENSGLDPNALRMLRDSAGKVTTLAGPAFDAYGAHMKAGQEHLAAGRFFDAEERFAAALGAKSGDPMAAVGRVHAELGAGMFMSASINLRALLVDHPELSAQKYAPELLPSKERMAGAIQRLTQLAAEGEGRGRDPALLLAYLGYQSGDARAMERGLDVMGSPPAGGGEDQLTRLAALLRSVWTRPSEPTPAPPAAEPKPAPPPKPEGK